MKIMIILAWIFLGSLTVQAQLVVSVSQPKVVGQKTVVKLVMKNNLTETVESARAVVFLLDDQGKMVGQSTKWVIGDSKDRPPLKPKSEVKFNFVVSSLQPFAATNLTAKISFSRVVLERGKLADVRRDVSVTTP